MLVPRKRGGKRVIKEGEEEAEKGGVTFEDLEGNKRQPKNRGVRQEDSMGREWVPLGLLWVGSNVRTGTLPNVQKS